MGKISILKKVYCCFILLFGDGSELRRKHKRILMVIKCFDMQTYRYDIKKIHLFEGPLPLLELFSCQNGVDAQHPLSDHGAYTKPGRMVSMV